MAGYKHIERLVGTYVASHYRHPVEIGVGNNPEAAALINAAGIPVLCTDIKTVSLPQGITFIRDDIFAPDAAVYAGTDVLYSIRPAGEMIPPMIDLARALDCDLLVCHLGFETFGDGGEIIDCGVVLHRYYRAAGRIR